jgi:8-oxo-dGTP pyrophosphatase MutT (NUDIX family)
MDKKRRGNLPRRGVEPGPLTGVGCVIYARNTQRFLFLLRSGNTKYSKTWGLPGGKVEQGESTIEGLRREILEEIGTVELSNFKHLETFTSDNTKFTFHTFYAAVEKEFIPDLNREHVGYCWVPIKEYPRPIHPGVWRSFQFNRVVEKLETMQALADVCFRDKVTDADVFDIR